MASHIRRLAAWLALAAATPFAQAAPDAAPLVECRGALPSGWTAGPTVSAHRCKLSMLRSNGVMPETAMDPLASQLAGDGLTGAYAVDVPVGLREWRPSGPPPQPADGLIDLSEATVVEQGRVGPAGELWWGRVSRGSVRCCSVGRSMPMPLNANPLHAHNESESLLLAVGQESSVRRLNAATSAADMQALMMGRGSPWPAGFTTLRYTQLAATSVPSIGSAPDAPGTLAHAVIDLSVPQQLGGVLRFTLTVAGKSSVLSMPLKRDVDEARASGPIVPDRPYRLKHARQSGGRMLDCHAAPGSSTPGPCHFDNQDETRAVSGSQEPYYTARGMFFGGAAEYLAIVFEALPPDPVNPKIRWGLFRGLVVLKRAP